MQARYIAATRPRWVALEQVPGALPLWKSYAGVLGAMGYATWCGVVDAADYGVPQNRRRAILIASQARPVSCPLPTHYDPSGPPLLFCAQWVSMADALGWGADGRPSPTVTAGGTKTGGAEPFGHRDRLALAAERDAGRWVLRTSFGEPSGERHGSHEMDPAARPAHAVTSKARSWSLRLDTRSHATLRSADQPAPTIQFAHRANLARWANWMQDDQPGDGTRITVEQA